jgi:hypothetical protein
MLNTLLQSHFRLKYELDSNEPSFTRNFKISQHSRTQYIYISAHTLLSTTRLLNLSITLLSIESMQACKMWYITVLTHCFLLQIYWLPECLKNPSFHSGMLNTLLQSHFRLKYELDCNEPSFTRNFKFLRHSGTQYIYLPTPLSTTRLLNLSITLLSIESMQACENAAHQYAHTLFSTSDTLGSRVSQKSTSFHSGC